MKVLAINNGRDRTAFTVMESVKGEELRVASYFLSGNIAERIKGLCRFFSPDKVVLQLPPTGLDRNTQKAIQEGFGRNVAAVLGLKKDPEVRDLMKARASLGCRRRNEARKFCGSHKWNYSMGWSRRRQMQIFNTYALAYDSIRAADSDIS